MRDLSEACKKYGIKFAVYLSPWDRHQANYGTPEYVDYFYRQLYELLTNYGPVFEIWFDGANGGDGWYGGAKDSRTIDRKTYYDYARAYEMIDKFQPQAVVFSDGGPGCRWVGNENGFAGATNWSFLRAGEVYPGYPKYRELQYGHADGNQWTAAECDVSIRPGWFYHSKEDSHVKSLAHLADIYFKSVGYNSVLLLNIPPNKSGLIHENDCRRLKEFFTYLKNTFEKDYLKRGRTRWEALSGTSKEYMVRKDALVNTFMIQEDITKGQRVESFLLEGYWDGSWRTLAEGTTVGYKRLVRFTECQPEKIRLTIRSARNEAHILRTGLFLCPSADRQ